MLCMFTYEQRVLFFIKDSYSKTYIFNPYTTNGVEILLWTLLVVYGLKKLSLDN